MDARDMLSRSLSEYLDRTCVNRVKPDRLGVYALCVAHDLRVKTIPSLWRAKESDPGLQQLLDPGRAIFQTLTGSVAEYKVRYLLTSIGDVDIMYWKNNEVVIIESDNHKYFGLPYVHKSEEFHDNIRCYLMQFLPRHPGYVVLHSMGTMEFSFETLKYRFSKKHYQKYFYTRGEPTQEMPENHFPHGPATLMHDVLEDNMKDMICESNDSRMKTDLVDALRCFAWPHQVSNFAYRARNHGWPNAKTIQEAIKAGCDIVGIGHPDELSVGAEWRLSFSRAEVVLLQSWTTKQQNVYNLARYYLKNEILKFTDNSPVIEKIMNSYLIKSEMLKLCEFRSTSWWENTDIIDICCTVFRALRKRLRKRKCCNYFIPPCNLLCHNVQDSIWTYAEDMLTRAMDREILTRWVLDHHFSYFRNNLHLEPTLHDASQIKFELDLFFAKERHTDFYTGIYTLYKLVEEIHESQLPRYCNTMNEIAKIDDRVLDYIKAHAYLFVCRNVLLKREPQNNSLYVINILTSMVVANQPHIVRNFPSTFSSETPLDDIYYVKSLELSEYLSQVTSFADVCLISNLLQSTLEYLLEHFGNIASYRHHSHVNLAALYYAMGEYDRSIEFCKSLSLSFQNFNLDHYYGDARRLVYIPEIADAFGFYVIYWFIAPQSNRSSLKPCLTFSNLLHQLHILGMYQVWEDHLLKDMLRMFARNVNNYWPMDVCLQAVVVSAYNKITRGKILIHNRTRNTFKYLDESKSLLFEKGAIEINTQDTLLDILMMNTRYLGYHDS